LHCKNPEIILGSFLRFYGIFLLHRMEKGEGVDLDEMFKDFIEFEIKVQKSMLLKSVFVLHVWRKCVKHSNNPLITLFHFITFPFFHP